MCSKVSLGWGGRRGSISHFFQRFGHRLPDTQLSPQVPLAEQPRNVRHNYARRENSPRLTTLPVPPVPVWYYFPVFSSWRDRRKFFLAVWILTLTNLFGNAQDEAKILDLWLRSVVQLSWFWVHRLLIRRRLEDCQKIGYVVCFMRAVRQCQVTLSVQQAPESECYLLIRPETVAGISRREAFVLSPYKEQL